MIKRIFIVDDRLHEVSWLTSFLGEHDCEITHKTNEKDTREHFRKILEESEDGTVPYTLAIVDIMCPVASMADLVVLDEELLKNSRDTGIRLCKFFRQELRLTEEAMHIVAVSARGDDDVVRELQALSIPLFGRDDPGLRDFLAIRISRPSV